ncbi:hypothetical protein [Parasitella parasitica]|uniref:ATP-dependent DNA helicase PIF1 n=1 Tax=Parasitella parasitica TaxID=35722 RepID=A0A0B7NVF9_9FUNG|nr:hypothetical protein [Parasitella parasitica]
MSQSCQEIEGKEQGFSIDENNYYHPNAALNGWTIHTCYPLAENLMPMMGKRISNVKPASLNEKKRSAENSEPESHIAKKVRTAPSQNLDSTTGQVQQQRHAQPESRMASPSQQQSRKPDASGQYRIPADTAGRISTIVANSPNNSSQNRRRVLPDQVFPSKDSVSIRNFNTATSSTSMHQANSASVQGNAAKPSRIQRNQEEALIQTVVYDPSLYDNLSKEQKKIHKHVVHMHENIFFTGSAGTGKSVLLRTLINSLQHIHGRDAVAITAPTGIAACNIGGVTIYSALAMGRGDKEPSVYINLIRNNPKMLQKINRLKVLIIDEISMIDARLFDKIDHVLRIVRLNENKSFGGIQLVLCGDFYQLPPIRAHGQDMRYTFQAQCWNRAVDRCMELKTVFRQSDQHFASLLNELRIGQVSSRTERELQGLRRALTITNNIEPTELYPLRKELNRANEERLNILPGESHTFRAVDNGSPYLCKKCIAPETITLKVDAQVMLVKNLTPTLVNGSRGVVVRFATVNGKLFPVVKFLNNTEKVITSESFTFESQGVQQAQRVQIPLILAWALSIHKSQGQTIECLKIDLQSVFDCGQAYVALSRATSMDTLQVLNFSRGNVKAHPKVAEFYRKMASDKCRI